jgi:tetratricopeptide (TPR) repeat protein
MHANRFSRRLLCAVALSFAGAVLSACGKDSRPAPPAPAPVAAVVSPGVDPYRKALAAQDSEETLRLLQEALRANPRLAEAWYEQGRLKLKLAPGIQKLDELQAVGIFREGLEAEKEALRLLDAGEVTVWTPAEQGHARAVLQGDLMNVDEVLADRDSLLYALRVRIY